MLQGDEHRGGRRQYVVTEVGREDWRALESARRIKDQMLKGNEISHSFQEVTCLFVEGKFLQSLFCCFSEGS